MKSCSDAVTGLFHLTYCPLSVSMFLHVTEFPSFKRLNNISLYVYSTFSLSIAKTNKQKNHLIEKWAKDLNRHFSKEDIQVPNQYMKRFSNSLIIRGMKIKTTVRYYLIPLRMAIIIKTKYNKHRPGCGKRGTLCTVGGSVRCAATMEKQYEGSSKN